MTSPPNAEPPDQGTSKAAAEEVEAGLQASAPDAPPPAPVGRVEGVVTTSRGHLAGAVVAVGDTKATTDSGGRFILGGLPVGPAKLVVSAADAEFESTSIEVEVREDEVREVFLYLRESPGTIEGVVTDEMGVPLKGAKVWGALKTLEPTTVETDKAGHYVLEGIPTGEHYLRARAPGYMTEGLSVRVNGNKTVECDFALKAGAIALSGKVRDKAGRPAQVDLYLMRKGVVVLKTSSSVSDGSYAFSDLLPGVYEVAMVSPGYQPQGWSGRLEKDMVLNFELSEPTVGSEGQQGV